MRAELSTFDRRMEMLSILMNHKLISRLELARRFSVSDVIANEFSMNKFTLCKKFKLDTGRTILDLLTQICLNHARDMLETTNLLITQVAADSGFNSVTYFSTIFKQTFNCTPLEYRNKFKKELYE